MADARCAESGRKRGRVAEYFGLHLGMGRQGDRVAKYFGVEAEGGDMG